MSSYAGLNKNTGKTLTGLEHIRQSVADILTTPVGSRVMRREYGALVFDLIDRPLSGGLLLQVYAAAYIALRRWEPRIRVDRISGERGAKPEQFNLEIAITRLDLPTLERATIAITVGRGL
jgi:phage baseplate assembly protein W